MRFYDFYSVKLQWWIWITIQHESKILYEFVKTGSDLLGFPWNWHQNGTSMGNCSQFYYLYEREIQENRKITMFFKFCQNFEKVEFLLKWYWWGNGPGSTRIRRFLHIQIRDMQGDVDPGRVPRKMEVWRPNDAPTGYFVSQKARLWHIVNCLEKIKKWLSATGYFRKNPVNILRLRTINQDSNFCWMQSIKII